MWLVWFGAAVIFFVIEILTPTFFVVCIGIGCLTAAILSLILPGDAYFWIHLASFGLATFVSFVAIQPLAKRIKKKGKIYKTNFESILGETGVVIKKIGPGLEEGRVLVQGASWRAVTSDSQSIDVDERVQVIKVEGIKLYVRALREAREKIA